MASCTPRHISALAQPETRQVVNERSCELVDANVKQGGCGLLLWFVILAVLVWFILYAVRPVSLQQKDENGNPTGQVDAWKALLAAIIIALIIILIIWAIQGCSK